MTTLQDLPNDIFGFLITFLTQFDILHLRRLNKYFYALEILKRKLQLLRDLIEAPINFWLIGNDNQINFLQKNGVILRRGFNFVPVKYYNVGPIRLPKTLNLWKIDRNIKEVLSSYQLTEGDIIFVQEHRRLRYINADLNIEPFPDYENVKFEEKINLNIFLHWRFWVLFHKYQVRGLTWNSFPFTEKIFYFPKLGFHLEFHIMNQDYSPTETTYNFKRGQKSPFYLYRGHRQCSRFY